MGQFCVFCKLAYTSNDEYLLYCRHIYQKSEESCLTLNLMSKK